MNTKETHWLAVSVAVRSNTVAVFLLFWSGVHPVHAGPSSCDNHAYITCLCEISKLSPELRELSECNSFEFGLGNLNLSR
eukprot:m.110356 g.110356  ORF g.110356 m.110356 type:complete len:80 (-) comp16979_c0_seq9:522-761(-)